MKKYTKLCLATLCFIASASTFADGYKGEAPPLVPVSIPSFNGGFEFTIGALYMTPDSSNLDYWSLYSTISGTPNSTSYRETFGIDPNYNWGFVLGLGYVIPNTANDVKLDWMYFHNDFSSSDIYNSPTFADFAFLYPAGDLSLNPFSVFQASGTINYKFDAVDLTFGQYLNMGSRLQTRLFTGLRYMRLDTDLDTAYLLTSTDSGRTTTITGIAGELDSNFNGLGPMIGIKGDFYLGAGFGLSGSIDGALLVGQISFDGNESQFVANDSSGSLEVTGVTASTFDWDSQNVIAPGYDAKFGLNYKYQFNNGTLLGLELGYQVTQYIDVIEEINRGYDTKPSLAAYDSNLTDFRLAGPYLTLNVKV